MPTSTQRPAGGPGALTPDQQEHAATLLKQLAHPQRLAITVLLAREGHQTVTQVYTALGMSQAVTSQHLVGLKDRSVLTSEKVGTTVRYAVRSPALAEAVMQLVTVAETANAQD